MPTVAPANPIWQIVTIDLEQKEAFQQKRRAFLEENRPSRAVERPECEEVAPGTELLNGDISDDDTVIMEPEVETLEY